MGSKCCLNCRYSEGYMNSNFPSMLKCKFRYYTYKLVRPEDVCRWFEEENITADSYE